MREMKEGIYVSYSLPLTLKLAPLRSYYCDLILGCSVKMGRGAKFSLGGAYSSNRLQHTHQIVCSSSLGDKQFFSRFPFQVILGFSVAWSSSYILHFIFLFYLLLSFHSQIL